jgi:hypothetical protein
VSFFDASGTDGGFLVPPDMVAFIFPFSVRRDMRTGETFDPTLRMPRRLKKAARKYRDGLTLGSREARRLWLHRLRWPARDLVRRFIHGTGDPNKRPIGFLDSSSVICVEEK